MVPESGSVSGQSHIAVVVVPVAGVSVGGHEGVRLGAVVRSGSGGSSSSRHGVGGVGRGLVLHGCCHLHKGHGHRVEVWSRGDGLRLMEVCRVLELMFDLGV